MRRRDALGRATIVMLVLGLGAGGGRAEDDRGDSAPPPAKKPAPPAVPGGQDAAEKKFRDFNEVVKGAEKIDGLFTLHRKDDHLYAEIKPQQFDQPVLVPIAIARGLAMAGQPLNFGDEWVITFRRVGDKVQVVRKNVHYKAPAGTPIEKAVKQNYTDSILLALPIVSVNEAGGQAVVVDFADIFLNDFAQLGFGPLDRNRTTWHKIKGFPNNVELQVEATFGGGYGQRSSVGGGDPAIDPRGRTVVVHYSLARVPDGGYKPRFADDRVGHFFNSTRDFGAVEDESNISRMVNRWRLEKADPKARLSAPKKQIVWYIEDNVPHEYRPFVEEGIREWNKAFEKIGFRDAIAVRWQEAGRDDFDPEDVNYCTFRWITSGGTFAMSCLRSNPLTGEMIDGDVIFDASWIKVWKQEYAFLTGNPVPTGHDPAVAAAPEPLGVARIISPIMAAKQGFGIPGAVPFPTTARPGEARLTLVPSGWNPMAARLQQRQAASGRFGCQFMSGMRAELGLAAIALASRSEDGPKDKDDKGDAEKKEKEKGIRLPDDFLGQLVKEVVMHEVGHSLGLRHNFKASTMLSADQLNDTALTRAKGMVGSVMDYNPINIAAKGQKQGDWTTTTIGPYDYWAIEYAYRPIDGNEADELKKIAARSPEPELAYATDEDMYSNNDPLVNTYDLGSDTLRFARDRITLAAELLKDLDAKVVKDGEPYARVRQAFTVLLSQWGNGAYLVASYIGGQSINRDHKGKNSRDPIVPVPAGKQRESLAFLVDQVLSDRAFKFSPALLRRLGGEHWSDLDGGMVVLGDRADYPVNEQVLGIQKIVLGQCLSADVLARLQNQELQVDAGADPLRAAEVFRALSDGIWGELSAPPGSAPEAKGNALLVSTIRRNLQREHLRRLSSIVLGNRRSSIDDVAGYVIVLGGGGGSYPADARSLARMHLKQIDEKIGKALETRGGSIDDTTRAHLEECRFRIGKVLGAAMQSNEP